MNDYVSRQYLLDEYDRQHKGPPGGARKIIEEAPSEDVVPVIRCRDCLLRDSDDGYCIGRGWPYQLVPDDGFCDKGKKKIKKHRVKNASETRACVFISP